MGEVWGMALWASEEHVQRCGGGEEHEGGAWGKLEEGQARVGPWEVGRLAVLGLTHGTLQRRGPGWRVGSPWPLVGLACPGRSLILLESQAGAASVGAGRAGSGQCSWLVFWGSSASGDTRGDWAGWAFSTCLIHADSSL